MYSIRRTKRDMIDSLPETPKSAQMIGHSTLEWFDNDGNRIIRFHLTDVVTFKIDGSIVLNSGGHQSVTTKRRFNENLNNASVYQKKHVWYLSTIAGDFPYFDGISVDQKGLPTPQTLETLINNREINRDQLMNLPAELQVSFDSYIENKGKE